MKIQKIIDVYLKRKMNVNSLQLVQYNTGVQLVFNVLDFDLPDNTTATLYVRKKSGKFVYQERGISVSGNTVTVDLENQALTEHGEAFYQLEFLSGTDTISTFYSSMLVDRSLASADAVESTTVIAAFEAKTAEQIAEIEAAAQNQIEVIRNLYNTYATKNEAAYAIKGNMSGAVVLADDVSPVEHNPNVWVHSKNLFSKNLLDGIIRSRGLELDDSGAGVYKSIIMTLRKGTYTVSFSKAVNIVRFVADGYYSVVGTVLGVKSYTFTTTTDGSVGVSFRDATSATTVWDDATKVQIETGEIATDYEPYIDPSAVTVKRVSKNLIDCELMKSEATLNGVTIKRTKDQLILNGTLTVDSVLFNTHFCYLGGLGNYYTLSYKYMGGTVAGSASVCVGDCETVDSARQSWANIRMQNSDNSYAYPMTKPFIKDLWFYATAGVVFTDYRIQIQLEPGKEATGFETCNGSEYAPSADGTVSGITSLSPNMTILTDTEGVIVECEYNVDTKAYINKMLSGASATRIADVELLASAWKTTEIPYLYSQIINIPGTTEFSQVNLNPSVEQMAVFYEKNLTFMTENENGIVTVYAIGQRPLNDYVIQTVIREVSA